MHKVLFSSISRIIQGHKDLVWVRLRNRAILAVFQNGLSVGDSDKVLDFWSSGKVVMVILH